MPVKIRLQRHGKKGKPFYWIVAADARSKRDGKYLEKLGTYNPNFNPAKIEINIDGTVQWLQNGAQPTDTAKSILSYKGILLKNHLIGGVRKGALTEDQAEAKFQAWVEEKSSKIDAKKSDLEKAKDAEKAKIFEAEKAANEARIATSVQTEEDVAEEVVADDVVAEEAPSLVAVTPPNVTDPPPSPYSSNMLIVTGSPDKQLPSQSKPSGAYVHDPLSASAAES